MTRYCCFADNVAYHKSNRMKRYLKSTKRQLVMIHFPKYTPELNPIENRWREIKKNLGNQFFSDTAEMKDCFDDLLRTSRVPVVKMYE